MLCENKILIDKWLINNSISVSSTFLGKLNTEILPQLKENLLNMTTMAIPPTFIITTELNRYRTERLGLKGQKDIQPNKKLEESLHIVVFFGT